MVKEIRWTSEAEETFAKIIDYLENNWTEREIEKFVNATDEVIEYISERLKMFRKTNKKNAH